MTCVTSGKQTFHSKGDAQKAARWLRRRYDRRLMPYQCKGCGKWHLGHP